MKIPYIKKTVNREGERMKIRKWLVMIVLFFVLIPVSVFAEKPDKDLKVSPKHVESGGIKLESKVYDLNQYEPVTHIKGSLNPFSSEMLDRALNQTANFFFSLTKLVASVVDTAIDKLYSLGLINDAADDIADVSDSVYHNLFATVGTMLVIIAVVQIFYYYTAERSGIKAGKTTLSLLAVLAFASIWFSNAGYYTKVMNGLSNEVQGLIMKAGTPLADQKVKSGEELEGSLAILRNSYFNLVVKKSYLIMNYGTPDEKEITKNDKQNENRINNLLEYKTTENGYKKRAELVENEATKLENAYMSPSTLTAKVGVAFCSFLFSLILGIPLLILAFLNPGIQILVLVFTLIFGISLLLSILPYFSNSGWKNFEKVAGLLLAKAFIGLAILFIFLIVHLMERFIPPLTPDMYMLNVIATAASIILAYKFRDQIVSAATGGRVTSVGGNTVKQMYEKGIKQPAAKMTALTKQAVAGAIGGPVGAVSSGTTSAQSSNSVGSSTASTKLQERSANRNVQAGHADTQNAMQKGSKNETPQTSTLSRLRKTAVNLPANIKDKVNTAKEAVTEDLPLKAQHTAAAVKDKAMQAKDNIVSMPKRVRNTLQEDRRQGEAGRQSNQTLREQRREKMRAEIHAMRERSTDTSNSTPQTPPPSNDTQETVRRKQGQRPRQQKRLREPNGTTSPMRYRVKKPVLQVVPTESLEEQQIQIQSLQIQENPIQQIESSRQVIRKHNKE